MLYDLYCYSACLHSTLIKNFRPHTVGCGFKSSMEHILGQKLPPVLFQEHNFTCYIPGIGHCLLRQAETPVW